jgi:hypothetical protein
MAAESFKGRQNLLIACRGFVDSDGESFQKIVAGTLDVLGLLRRELAASLNVSPFTVSRWASGSILPPRWRRQRIVHDIVRLVQQVKRPRVSDLRAS